MQEFTFRETGCSLHNGPKLPCQPSSRLKKTTKQNKAKQKNKNKLKQKVVIEKKTSYFFFKFAISF